MATVAGNPITLKAFNHWAYVAAKEQAAQYASQGVPPIISSNPTNFSSCMKAIRAGIPTLRTAADATLKSDCKQVYSSTETEVMNFLIQSYWIQAAAHKAGINGSNLSAKFDKALSKQYPTKAKVNAYLAAALKSSGQTKADMFFTYRVQSLLEKLIKRAKKPVTSKAIAAYYAAHKSTFGSAETRDLHLIRTKTQSSAQAAYNALKGGQSWDTVAKHYAADASAKANGGSLSNATSGEEESAASKAIFSAPLNQLTGPVKGLFGYYVLEVSKITPATQESLAKATPAIKSQLNSTGSQSAEQDVLKAAQKAWTNQTKCRSPHYTTSYCSNYVKPKTTTTATSTPTSTATTPSSGTATASNTTTTSTK